VAINQPRQLQPNAPATGAKVTSQTPQLGTDPSGRAVHGVTIAFQLPSGTPGSVFVPDSDYTVENVTAAVAAKAYAMKKVEEQTY